MLIIGQRGKKIWIPGCETYGPLRSDLHIPCYDKDGNVHHTIYASGYLKRKAETARRRADQAKGKPMEFDDRTSITVLRALERSVQDKMARFYSKFDALMDEMYLAREASMFEDEEPNLKHFTGLFLRLDSEISEFYRIKKTVSSYDIDELDACARDCVIRLKKTLDINIKSIKVCVDEADSYYARLYQIVRG